MPQSTQCLDCLHYQGQWECAAFPDGIPTEIVEGFDHRDSFEGDKGIRFEPLEDDGEASKANEEGEE